MTLRSASYEHGARETTLTLSNGYTRVLLEEVTTGWRTHFETPTYRSTEEHDDGVTSDRRGDSSGGEFLWREMLLRDRGLCVSICFVSADDASLLDKAFAKLEFCSADTGH